MILHILFLFQFLLKPLELCVKFLSLSFFFSPSMSVFHSFSLSRCLLLSSRIRNFPFQTKLISRHELYTTMLYRRERLRDCMENCGEWKVDDTELFQDLLPQGGFMAEK